jgi:hypothetical protein
MNETAESLTFAKKNMSFEIASDDAKLNVNDFLGRDF